ncbi:hypothetical protein ABZ832_23900, partial [Streptantibioticus parmotrematis]|uniref:HAMP domain-containing protein n=1 Tax=Streptantibioticus parmotrematis TaxID=2873249 RepID=UPI003407CB87
MDFGAGRRGGGAWARRREREGRREGACRWRGRRAGASGKPAIAEVTTAVAKGDLSQKIRVDARGEIL